MGSFVAAAMTLLPAVALADHTTFLNDDGVSIFLDPSEGEIFDATYPTLTDSCSSCIILMIDGAAYFRSGSTLDLGGRQAVSGSIDMSGLTVSRKTYIPQSSNWVRSLNILQNETAGDITVTVRIRSSVTVQNSLAVLASSSSDAVFDLADLWLTTTGDGDGVSPYHRSAHWPMPGGMRAATPSI